jgi:hypothetical protein
MSGLTGHINHLYEDPELTLSDLVKIYRLISSNSPEIKPYEKVDGYNLYISFSARERKAKLIRNMSQAKIGGITIDALKASFTTDRIQGGKAVVPSNIVSAYVNAITMFEKIILQIFTTDESIKLVFGEDQEGNPEFFFNADIIDPSATNLIKYDRKLLVFHRLGNIKLFDGEIKNSDTEELQRKFSELEKIFGRAKDFEIAGDKVSTINSIDKAKLSNELSNLRSEFKRFGLDMEDTIGKYFIKSAEEYFLQKGIKFEPSQEEFVVESILAVGFGRRFLKKPKINDSFTLPGSPETARLKNFSNEEPAMAIFKTLKMPLEKIIFDISSVLLDRHESLYVTSNKQTTDDISKLINQAVEKVSKFGSSDTKKKLQTNINKLNNSSTSFSELINNPVEGIVFSYNNNTYKITSSFGPVNQIVYMSKQISPINEASSDKVSSMKVLFAGAFKPPHKGHLDVIKNFIEMPRKLGKNFIIEKVIVILGDKSRTSANGTEFDVTQAMDLFKVYLQAAGLEDLVELRVTSRGNPVKDVYDYIANTNNDADKAQAGDLILLGVSGKDRGHYTNIDKFVDGKPWRVIFGDEYEMPIVFHGKPRSETDVLSEFHAREFREAIVNNNTSDIDSFLPDVVLANRELRTIAYNILRANQEPPKINETVLVNIIEERTSRPTKKMKRINLAELVDRVESIYLK